MQTLDVNSLFSRAERAFAAGQLDAARGDLDEVKRIAGQHPAVLHLCALVEKKAGAADAAGAAFLAALRLAPTDPQINNNYANLLNDLGEVEAALAHYERALATAPSFHDARYNRALLLQRLGRPDEALADLDLVAAAQPHLAKVHSARGSVLRDLHRLKEAAEAYDAALRLEPQRLVAVHGRARVAMERGESGASELYRRALALQPGDAELMMGLAEALEAEGRAGAVDTLAAAVASHPYWVEGQTTLARMRWEAGEERAFTRTLESAVAAAPKHRRLWLAYVSVLAAVDLWAEAADAAAAARAALGGDTELALLEALHASEAGQMERADRLFAALPGGGGRAIAEARHRLRVGDYHQADFLVAQAREDNPFDIGAWALTGLVWRLIRDERSDWLSVQAGLIDARRLPVNESVLRSLADRLRSLHRTRAHPIGQSLRGGTQTRGRLFERDEPEIVLLKDAIALVVADFWRQLPPFDPDHPLLRHREARPHFDGSWSVRLTGGGFHVSHFHPNGILSSACYLVIPEPRKPMEGWLEIGGAPGNLELPLEPLARVEPKPGLVALFPSYLFHGTRPFSEGERLTCAFDVAAA